MSFCLGWDIFLITVKNVILSKQQNCHYWLILHNATKRLRLLTIGNIFFAFFAFIILCNINMEVKIES